MKWNTIPVELPEMKAPEDDEQSDTAANEELNTDDVWSGFVESNFVTATDTFQEFVDAEEWKLAVCEEASTDDTIVVAVRRLQTMTTRTARMMSTRHQNQILRARTHCNTARM
ncbi:hypothetical protein HPB50_016699 [Hyalomma asiaticum]|uniref:Uncharacterized protein n=1 Tax=Hyalomma asiaticum TaxID=266040 RepID=A0ACB7RPV2_HYAAI|nr:hypothetical protein HPB50_016699 [Hyalomma asiaticum]